MATVFEPPPLLAVLVVLAATALAYAAGIRRRLPGGLAGAAGAAESELDERWGSEAPEEISFADLFARGRRRAPPAAPDLPDREVASSK